MKFFLLLSLVCSYYIILARLLIYRQIKRGKLKSFPRSFAILSHACSAIHVVLWKNAKYWRKKGSGNVHFFFLFKINKGNNFENRYFTKRLGCVYFRFSWDIHNKIETTRGKKWNKYGILSKLIHGFYFGSCIRFDRWF